LHFIEAELVVPNYLARRDKSDFFSELDNYEGTVTLVSILMTFPTIMRPETMRV
jgi:hypothetical protein